MQKNSSDFDQALDDYIENTLAFEKSTYSSDIEPFEVHADKIRASIATTFQQFQKRFALGHHILLAEIEKELTPDKETLASYLIHDEKLHQLKNPDDFFLFLAEKRQLYDVLGLSQEAVVTFYRAACSIIDEKRYDEGVNAFFFLVTIAAQVADFWLNLGYCYSQIGEYEPAIEAYSRGIDLNPRQAGGYLSLTGTYVRLQQYEKGKEICAAGIELARSNRDEPWAQELERMLKGGLTFVAHAEIDHESGARS